MLIIWGPDLIVLFKCQIQLDIKSCLLLLLHAGVLLWRDGKRRDGHDRRQYTYAELFPAPWTVVLRLVVQYLWEKHLQKIPPLNSFRIILKNHFDLYYSNFYMDPFGGQNYISSMRNFSANLANDVSVFNRNFLSSASFLFNKIQLYLYDLISNITCFI